jgi:hypothetical protein
MSLWTKHGKGVCRYVLAIGQVVVADDEVNAQLFSQPRLGVRFDPDVGSEDELIALARGFLDDLVDRP